MTRPQPGEYAPYFDRYISLTRGADAIQNLEDSALDLYEVLAELDDEKGEFAYARDKWSIVQMIRHLIDTDMVFTYRALYFCRNQGGELAGYDHEAWARESLASELRLALLNEEFMKGRQFLVRFYRGLSEQQLEIIGKVEGKPTSVRSIPFILSGHVLHHLNILRDRYLT